METIGIFGTIFIGASLLLFVAAVVMAIWALYKVIKATEEKREFDTKNETLDWLLAHHFDVRGLIDKELAIKQDTIKFEDDVIAMAMTKTITDITLKTD